MSASSSRRCSTSSRSSRWCSAGGRTHWLATAAREIEIVLERVRDIELLRAIELDSVAGELGLDPNPGLHEIADRCQEPWKSIWLDHRDAFTTTATEIQKMSLTNRELLTAGYHAAQATLLSMTEERRDVRRRRLGRHRRPSHAASSTGASDVSGTFSSLSTALSAMRYNQVAMDVASGNVANSGTAGYARRQVVGQATGAPSVPAMWSRWEGAGDGVQPGPVTRMVDPLLDARARTEHASGFFLDARAASLVRFETTLGEPGDNGLAAALSSFKAGWHDVANNPGDEAARSPADRPRPDPGRHRPRPGQRR